MNHALIITNLTVHIEPQLQIINSLNLTLAPGSIHALMGPNGSGKSTLAYTLMGHPNYQCVGGSIIYKEQDLSLLSPDKRAKLGIFLAMQHPCELPGVTVRTFLKEAYHACTSRHATPQEFQDMLTNYMEMVGLDPSFAYRAMHEGFSGGEKKRLELLQMLILKPSLIILDEIDSGLDVDALKRVATILSYLKQHNSAMTVIVITHYHRILEYIVPDYVHIMMQGALVKSGAAELAFVVEKKGYDGIANV